MACKCISHLVRSRPPGESPKSLDHDLQLDVQTRSIAASKCISKLAQSRPPVASPNTFNRGLHVHLQTRSITALNCISKLARSWPPSAAPKSLNYSLPVYLQTRLITASECISKFSRSRCGETLELEGRQRIINTLPHLAWHPKGIRQKQRFWLEERRKRVRGSTQIAQIYECLARVHETKSWER